MKIVLFVGLLAVLVSRSEAASCEDIELCISDLDINERNIDRLCSSLRAAILCIRPALKDCRDKEAVPATTLDTMDKQMRAYSDMMDRRCSGQMSGAARVFKTSAMVAVTSFLTAFLL